MWKVESGFKTTFYLLLSTLYPYRLILCKIPNPAIIETKLLPPELKKGKGNPVTGSKPTFTPALTNTWEKIKTAKPIEKSLPKLEAVVRPIVNMRYIKKVTKPKITI